MDSLLIGNALHFRWLGCDVVPFEDGVQSTPMLEHCCAEFMVHVEALGYVMVTQFLCLLQLVAALVAKLTRSRLTATSISEGPFYPKTLLELLDSMLQIAFCTFLLHWIFSLASVENGVAVVTVPCAKDIA